MTAPVRVRLDLGYDGTDFHGWARQPGLRTVEGELSKALTLLSREPVDLTVAGRTDAGVHARHQVAHADLPVGVWARAAERFGPAGASQALSRRLNGVLARSFGEWASMRGKSVPRGTSDVVVHDLREVGRHFDARFAATGRHYSYRMSDQPQTWDPLRRRDVVRIERGKLNVSAMGEAARVLLGEHDFLSFCRPREGATTIRTLRELSIRREGDLVVARIEADAFCHSMVRSLVGACLEVGLGRKAPTWTRDLLEARSRDSAAPIAPAHGLVLEKVDYPPEAEWARRITESRRRRDSGPGGECC